jgi:small-conductance mechanosensitive channel
MFIKRCSSIACMVYETIVNAYTFLNSVFSGFVTKFTVALLFLVIGLIVGKIVGKLIYRLLHEIELNQILKQTVGLRVEMAEIVGKGIQYFIYLIFIIITLETLGIESLTINIIFGGIIVLIVLSVFLGIKDFIPNLIAGMYIHQKHFISEGDIISFNDITGKVVHVYLVETQLMTKSGDTISVPNQLLIKSKLRKLKKKKL